MLNVWVVAYKISKKVFMRIKKRIISIIVSAIILISIAVPVSATVLTVKSAGLEYKYYNSFMCERAYATCTASGGGIACFNVCWVIDGKIQHRPVTNIYSGQTRTARNNYVDKGTNYPYVINMYQL